MFSDIFAIRRLFRHLSALSISCFCFVLFSFSDLDIFNGEHLNEPFIKVSCIKNLFVMFYNSMSEFTKNLEEQK